jgi:hypothetical protein
MKRSHGNTWWHMVAPNKEHRKIRADGNTWPIFLFIPGDEEERLARSVPTGTCLKNIFFVPKRRPTIKIFFVPFTLKDDRKNIYFYDGRKRLRFF